MDKLLQKYGCAPSQVGKEWAQKFWKGKKKVVECVKQCQVSQKLRTGKGRGVICAVLGACVSCAQKEAKEAPAPALVSAVEHAALKSENEVLISALAFQKETGEKLETQVSKLTSENEKLENQVDELLGENRDLEYRNARLRGEAQHFRMLLEKMNGLLDKMQPSAQVQQIRKLMRYPSSGMQTEDFCCNSDDEEVSEVEGTFKSQVIPLRPLVKTETAVDDDDEIHTTTRTVPWTPTELERIKEKYSRQPSESAVEYVWRVSAEGGDRIMLSEDEAGDSWGPEVFLTTMPGDHCYSLTARAAYWAGGMDPRERGVPLEMRAKGYSDLSAAVREAACLQAMYDREEFRKSPMLAPIDPDRLAPLIRGFPDCLKPFTVETRNHIREICDNPNRRRSRRNRIPTWNEFVQEIDKYGHQIGWATLTGEKPPDPTRRIRQVHIKDSKSDRMHTHDPKPDGRFKPDKEQNELWRKALDLGVPRWLLHGVPTEDLRALVQSLTRKNNSIGVKHPTGESLSYDCVVPSAPEYNMTDWSESQQKNSHPPGGQ